MEEADILGDQIAIMALGKLRYALGAGSRVRMYVLSVCVCVGAFVSVSVCLFSSPSLSERVVTNANWMGCMSGRWAHRSASRPSLGLATAFPSFATMWTLQSSRPTSCPVCQVTRTYTYTHAHAHTHTHAFTQSCSASPYAPKGHPSDTILSLLASLHLHADGAVQA
jgi:hypothetical protein